MPMIPSLRAVLVALVLLIPSYADSVANQGNGLFYRLDTPNRQSVLIQRLSDGKVIYEENADEALSPASVTKVVTAAAALNAFSPRHRFKTRFYHTGTRQGGTVQGDLVVVGDGDAFIVNELLWQIATDLRILGLKKVTGDIVIDNSLFDGQVRDRSRAYSQKASSHAYDAPVTAFGVNFNTYAVAMTPGAQGGEAASAVLDPYAIPSVAIVNRLRTSAAQGAKFDVDRTSSKNGDQLIVSGSLGKDDTIRKVYRSVNDPVRVSGETLRAFLEREGVSVQGAVREGNLAANAKLLYTFEGHELAKIVDGLNKFSNNFIADMVTKRLGALRPRQGRPEGPGQGSLENGVYAIGRFMKEDVGITTPFTLYNGSGLDTANRLSARQVVQVLKFMESRFDLFPEFLNSLPSSAEDGTLAKRFRGKDGRVFNGLIRAKTGTLSDPIAVASLAGYLRHPRHGMVAFAVIDNGVAQKPQPSIADLRERQDQAIIKLLNQL